MPVAKRTVNKTNLVNQPAASAMMNEVPSPAPKSDETNSQIPSFIPEPDEPVDIAAIAGDILQQRCVLLIGPGLLHIGGLPVSEALRQHLVTKHARLLQGVYKREGLYKFRDETAKKRAQTDAIPQFFREAHPDEAALSKLLAIPFHLMLQVTPDTFLSDRALAHSVNHEFRYFCGGGKPVEPVELPTAAAPLFYNLCGTADRFDSMVLDYDDVYEYLKSVFSQPGLPQNLRTALDEANTFLFLGFPLEKWYTQLLIRWVSDVKGAERYADRFDAGENDPDLKGFVRRHLNIVTAPQRCFDLVDELYHAFPENQLRPLAEPVTPNTVTMRRYVLNGELEKALLTFDKIAGSIGEKDTAALLISQFNELKRGLNTYALTKEQFWEKCQNLKFRLLETGNKYAYTL